ncbi:uncharacterized protein LOC117817557 [Xyrichtys novacula]|uniref:Uncharacterized protein LOC117817557 n=1 Tax=Xyrichtys novacula TaxID=13765 RepID=A0AAV1HNV4_XYRNO|nr:uncharacterized protein LOC117817557 [Xyrichtys novacula]
MYLPELSSGSEAEPSPHNRHRPLLLTFALPRSAFLCCPKEEDQTQSEHHVCTSTANEANNEKEEHRVHSEGNMEKKKKNLMVHRSTDLLESRKRLKEETVMLMWTLEKVILDLKHDPGSSSDSLSCSQISWRRREEDGSLKEMSSDEGEQLELRESGRTVSILMIPQRENRTDRYLCTVLHQGSSVDAHTEQEVPAAPETSCPLEREPTEPSALQETDCKNQDNFLNPQREVQALL